MIRHHHQKQAVQIWHSLPHLLIGLAFLLLVIGMGFNPSMQLILPALPLMVALIWSWEWRSAGIGLSLLAAGLGIDLISGLPLGWHSLLWAGTYMLASRLGGSYASDTPFLIRWLSCSGWLMGMLWVELLLAIAYGLAVPSIPTLIFRWLFMLLAIPSVGWVAWRVKKTYYRRLWMRLPEDMRINFR